MTTRFPANNNASGTQFPKTSGSTSTSSSTSAAGGYNLKPDDFIKMMVTQLQNQDPTNPTQSDQLLSQMSQIGQLQTNTQLQSSLQSMVTQSQIGSAGNLIGKQVGGLDDAGAAVQGIVNSVKVNTSGVFLQLDNGKELSMAKVSSIAPAPAVAAQKV